MKRLTQEAARSLVAGAVIYVAMAACSGSGGAHGGSSQSGGSGGVAQAGVGGLPDGSEGPGGVGGNGEAQAKDGSMIDAVTDALTDPVPDARADTNQSGTRLKARRYIASDGAQQFVDWYDSQLQVECAFQTAADGVMRCLPAFGTTSTIGSAEVDPGYFSDSACTQPVAVPVFFCPPKYAVQEDLSQCPPRVHIYPVEGQATQIYSENSGNCTASSSTQTRYLLGPEVPPSTFVAATVQIDP